MAIYKQISLHLKINEYKWQISISFSRTHNESVSTELISLNGGVLLMQNDG
jgi:hypothetical protein